MCGEEKEGRTGGRRLVSVCGEKEGRKAGRKEGWRSICVWRRKEGRKGCRKEGSEQGG